jgi:hypothetical protein
MRRIIALTTLALVITGATAFGSTLGGSYKTKIKGNKVPAFNATWVLNFKAGSKYTIARNGAIVVRGKDTITAKRIKFGQEKGSYACLGKLASGTYSWTLKSNKLTFKRVSDGCPGRKIVLTSNSFTKT